MALENGASLVVELPFLVSVQAADFFGQDSVDIGSFGHYPSLWDEEVLDYQQKLPNLYRTWSMELFMENLPDSLSYPQKTQACGRSLRVLIFLVIRPIMSLRLPMLKR